MKKKKGPQPVKLDQQELDALKQRITDKKITEDDLKLFLKLIEFNLWLQAKLARAKLSIHRLRKMFGFKSEKRSNKKNNKDTDGNSDTAKVNDTAPVDKLPPAEDPETHDKASLTPSVPVERIPKISKTPTWDPAANHGRHGFDDYAGCETITVHHDTLSAGMACPGCVEHDDHGKLYVPDDAFATYIVLEGQCIITGKRYQAEQYRCSFCGTYYTAEVPNEIRSQKSRYDESCASTLAIHRYYFGMPFKRIEKAQAMHKIPVPDATQWDKVSEAWGKLKPVYQALRELAAEGQPCYDDTPNKITSSIPLPDGRKGIYTTAIVSRLGSHDIFLFQTSHQYGGENIGDVFSSRKSEEPILSMSDASRHNIPKNIDEALLIRWICCFCLAHGRRKFYEILGNFTLECHFVLDVIGRVYEHDKECRDRKLNDEQRLNYHQEHSAPLMQSLWAWLNNKLTLHEVEDNSDFGEAIRYLLKYWKQLTQFLRIPGALLDNNLCERAIKVVIRHRRNSLFFRSFLGAEVGDGFMSLIHTAVMAGIDAFDYLTVLQHYHKQVGVAPEEWLPWRYQATLARCNPHQEAA